MGEEQQEKTHYRPFDYNLTKRYCKDIDWKVNGEGISLKCCNARFQAAQLYLQFGYVREALAQTMKAKNELVVLVREGTRSLTSNRKGYDIFDFDAYCKEKDIETPELQLFWSIILLEAPHKFDSYMLYLEKNRLEKDKFYYPRRDCLRKTGVVDALQFLEDDKLDILSISLPPGTGKTTLEKFFCTWIIGRHPDDYSLFFSHSSDITRMFYDGVLDILTNTSEYLFNVIFPGITVESSNAKIGSINVGTYKPFASLQTTSVGAKNAGKVRANKYLLCDDLVSGIAEALSIERLNTLWTTYGVDAKQRKTVDADNKPAKELHIATRWSVHDIIGRLKNIYKGDNRAMFIAVPDIDPKTGKSNFEYKIGGMTVEFFNDQAKTMDDISYRCLYKNEPIEREGILYHEDELRTYLSLPERKPDAILAVCDTKSHGTDFMVMPIVYQYVITTDDTGRPIQSDYYLVDCVCDDSSDYGVQYTKLANKLYDNNVQQCEFESNAGGDRISYEVNKRLEALGGTCNITDKPTETNKETRIIVNADWVKKNILFKDKTMYAPKEDYGILMSWLCRYSLVGKNEHDDVPDALANLKLFIDRGRRKPTVSAVFNPFRSDNYIPTFR